MSNSSKDQKYDEGYAAGFADGLRSCQEQNQQRQINRTIVQTNRRSPSEDNNRTFTNTIKKTRLSNELPNRRVFDKKNIVTNTKRDIGLIESSNNPTRRTFEERSSKPDEHDSHGRFNNPARGSIENPFQQRKYPNDNNRTFRVNEQEIQRKYPNDNNRTFRVNEQEIQRKYPNDNRPYRSDEHEMEGRNTLPDTEVKLNSQGHY